MSEHQERYFVCMYDTLYCIPELGMPVPELGRTLLQSILSLASLARSILPTNVHNVSGHTDECQHDSLSKDGYKSAYV